MIMASILSETERYRESVRKQQFEINQVAKNDLTDVHAQQLPEGVLVHSIATDEEETPSLVNIEEGEEDDDFEDDPEIVPADDDTTTKAKSQSRRHKKLLIIQQN